MPCLSMSFFISPFSTWGTNPGAITDARKTFFAIDKSIFLFFLLALDFKVDPLGRPRFLILVGSLKGEDNKHSLPLGSGNRWKEKNPLYDFFSCFQCQNWPEVTMCCYNMLCTNAIVECPGPKIKT